MDTTTRSKWDRASRTFDLMASRGAERRWLPAKQALFSHMEGNVLFLALGTGLDIAAFPPDRTITAIDISPKMVERARPRVEAYPGAIDVRVMDVHDLDFRDGQFDQIFTSCTFCSVPRPVAGLGALRRVLKPGGELFMFEHTGSRYYPFKWMMQVMSVLSERLGPAMDRDTVANVRAAGFQLVEVNNIYLDVVKTIRARNPG